MKVIRPILRILLAVAFAISAVAKLDALDAFEVYLFRTTLWDYDLSSFLARLIVSAELLIAFFLLIPLYFRLVWWFIILFILAFSGFLLAQVLGGAEENCFCMGELVDFSPTESLMKNAVLLLLLLPLRKTPDLRFRGRSLAFSGVILAALAVPMIISPPDFFLRGSFDPAEHDQKALSEATEEEMIPQEFLSGRKVVAFYSTGCRFCKMASTRIAATIEKNELDTADFNILFWRGTPDRVESFYEETHSPSLAYRAMDTKPYLDITKGRMPLILLIQDGEVVDRMNYRSIEEEAIVEFLQE